MSAYYLIAICAIMMFVSECQAWAEIPETEQKDPNFYQSAAWKALRKRVFAAWGRICLRCLKNIEPMTVDHILPRSKYPELELEFTNMQPLCDPCNKAKSNTDYTDYRDYTKMNEL